MHYMKYRVNSVNGMIENIGPYLAPFREATKAIESSDLGCTIFRPAWLTNYDEINYEVTQR